MTSKLQSTATSVVIPTAKSVITPIVKNRRPVVVSCETFVVMCHLSQFLSIINHKRSFRYHGADHKRWYNFRRIFRIFPRGKPYFIMIFKKVEHFVSDAVHALPAPGELRGGNIVFFNSDKSVIQIDLVIQVIEMAIIFRMR